jgi:CheY-like chemotaxis protein
MGMDMIRRLVAEMERKICDPVSKDLRLIERLVVLKSQLKAMEVESEFMKLTINRCLDQTKISNGTSLTYQPETIDIRESLEKMSLFAPLVLGMNVAVVVDRLPIAICPYIITDPSWLQENIICLIEQTQNCLIEESKSSSSKVLTIRVSLEVDPSSIKLSTQQLSLKSIESPMVAGRQVVPASQQYNMTPRRPTEMKSPMSPSRFTMRLANSVRQNASVETNQVCCGNGTETVDGISSLSSTTSSAELEATLSLAPEYQIRVEVMVNAVESSTTVCADQLFRNGKSLAGMNCINFQERLRSVRGYSGKVTSCKASSWYFCIPYRPDTARNLVRASFFGAPAAWPTDTPSQIRPPSLILPNSINGDCTVNMPSASADKCDAVLCSSSLSSGLSIKCESSPRAKVGISYVPISPKFVEVYFNPQYLACSPKSMKSIDTLQSFGSSGADDEERKLSPTISSETSTVDSGCSIRFTASSPSVCLIDDSNLVLKLTRTVLERSGYVVHMARNGLEAVQLVCDMLSIAYSAGNERRSRGEDITVVPLPIVLMDLQMPVLDGIEAVRRIRMKEKQLQSNCNSCVGMDRLVICSLSANNDDYIVDEALEAGCDAFLQKPFNLEDFQQAMQQIRIFRLAQSQFQ